MSNATANPPQTDVISVTPIAADQIRHLADSNSENAGKFLRIYIEPGGCSGMQYGMVFDQKRPDDLTTDMHGVSVLVDPVSAQHLRGSVVDFHDTLNSSGFKITNPNARQSCGCGKSFEA